MNQNQATMELPGDPLVDSISEKLEALSSLSTNCCIYKVHDRLRRLNLDAYSPRVVSIGPLHHGKEEELEAIEDHKLRFLQSFILRTALSFISITPKVSLSPKSRSATSQKLSTVILFEQCHRLDACFFHYMRFLSCFVTSPMDAELFIDNEIIVIRRGNAEDVSRLFTTILKETTQTNYRGRGTCQLLREAIPVNDLKGLGECLENKEIKKPIVVVRGTVGSTSTVDNSCLGVFIEETASLDIEKMNAFGSVIPESKTNFLSRKEVPWYLDDGTARVYVCNYQLAEGFYDTLKKYLSKEPVITYLKTFASDGKEKLIMVTDADCWKRQKVLEIGTDLTVVGTAMRDKDGAPTIADAYRFFNGHIELDDFVNYLESGLEIKISDITEALYRNIILFEQCHRLDACFFHYMRFLSCFVTSPMDAEFFIDNGIIVIRRGNAEDISRLFTTILKETTLTNYRGRGFYYQTVYDNLQGYCNRSWNMWKATLRRDYFHNPCCFRCCCCFLPMMTFIQALCSILALEL
ncbi:LOW QUALITY PROTEIN: hypothetical protein BRARA_C00458, partial [Brassica rapa]